MVAVKCGVRGEAPTLLLLLLLRRGIGRPMARGVSARLQVWPAQVLHGALLLGQCEEPLG